MLSDRRRSLRELIAPAEAVVTTVAAAVAAVVLTVACTPGATSTEEEDEATNVDAPAATVTIPPVRLTPFCQEMIDLADRLETDPPDDVEAEIIATYERIEDEVPAEIRDDFDAVLAELRGQAVNDPTDTTDPGPDAPTTTAPLPLATDATGGTLPPGDPFADEGYDPDDDPALRLNAYVDFECRDVANNPGPPPTQPLTEPATTEG